MLNKNKREVGSLSSDFTLLNTQNQEWSLKNSLGKVVALLFYPKDETLVCTRQLCSVRDNWEKYLDTEAEVIGVSPGTTNEHSEFAKNHKLPLPILADPERKITSTFAKHKLLPIWSTRGVVVIDAKGYIRYKKVMFLALRPTDEEVLAAINLAKYDKLASNTSLAV